MEGAMSDERMRSMVQQFQNTIAGIHSLHRGGSFRSIVAQAAMIVFTIAAAGCNAGAADRMPGLEAGDSPVTLAQNNPSRATEAPLRKIIAELQRGAPDAA